VNPATGAAPLTGFTGTPISGHVHLFVQFTDSSTGPITSWAWSFGDGNSSTIQSPAFTYSNAGIYTVSLTVSNSTGINTLTRTNYITVNLVNHAPVAIADSYTTNKNTVLRVVSNGVLMNDYDPDGDTLIAMLVTNPVHGNVILNNNG
jgi:PKD repeat protein